MKVILCFTLHPALLGGQFVAVLPDHGFQLGQSGTDGHSGILIRVFLFNSGLAGGELHLHRVFPNAGNVTHGLALKAGYFINFKIRIVDIAVSCVRVPLQEGLKSRVQILINPVRGVRPAVGRAVLPQNRDALQHQNQQQHQAQSQPQHPIHQEHLPTIIHFAC